MKHFLFILFAIAFLNSCGQNSVQLPTEQIHPGYFYVRTADSLPFLNYGLGTDRLGGAKMTFLDSNVLLKVVDSFSTLYKVQLSSLHDAWIEKSKTKTTGLNDTIPSSCLSGSWKVYGDSAFDYVTISIPQRLPYRSRMEIEPARIVVDLFGVTSNTNWITQLKTNREIKNVWYNQSENDMMQVFIELNHQTHWGYHIYYDSLQNLVVRIKRPPAILSLKNLKIAVDAGHGGDQTGTTGVRSGIPEKDLTLLYARELRAELIKRGAKVVMTREKDTTLSMYERIQFLEKENPALLISIHFNDSSRDTVQGVSTYYRYIGFRPLSQFILAQMATTGLKEFGNVGSFNFSLNGPTQYPNCLVEVAFLSNKDDEKKVTNPAFRKLTAQKIANGIAAFLRSASTKN